MKEKIKNKTLVLAFGAIVIIFVLIQLIPYGRAHTNPAVVTQPTWDSPQTLELAKRACFDCHSNETTWPWYSNIAPVSWLVQRDVDVGRRVFNFSDITGGRLGNQGDIKQFMANASEIINEGEMPPFYYLPMHPTAKLTLAEKQQLIQGLIATGQK